MKKIDSRHLGIIFEVGKFLCALAVGILILFSAWLFLWLCADAGFVM